MHPVEGLVLTTIELKADSIQLVGDKPTSKIQLSKVGNFKSSRYGKFSITESHVDKIIENRKASSNDPPIDYHHLSISALLPDQAIAAGWIKDLEKAEDKSLWGTVEWTSKAAKHIQEGEFKYISPVIVWDGKNEQNESVGTTLMSAALTNYPFLKGMAPISLSELQAQGIVLADLSIDQKRARISEALQIRHQNSSSYCWLRDVFDDYVVYELGAKMYKLGYNVSDKFEVSFKGEPEEVVPQYASLSEQTAHGGKKKMAEQNNQTSPEIAKLQSDFAAMQTQLTDTAAKVVSLTAELSAEKTENDKLRKQMSKTSAESKVAALIRQGKLVPTQKEEMVELAITNEAFFDKIAAKLPQVVKLNTEHGTNAGDENAAVFTTDGQDPIALFDDEVAKYREKNPKASITEAMEAVDKANPGLYDKRQKMFARTTAVAGSVSVQ